MKRWIAGVLAAALLAGVANARAGDATAAGQPGVSWQQLSPEQQRALSPYRNRWDQLPPGQQAHECNDPRAACACRAADEAVAGHATRRARACP
jgi:hypothetical protein